MAEIPNEFKKIKSATQKGYIYKRYERLDRKPSLHADLVSHSEANLKLC